MNNNNDKLYMLPKQFRLRQKQYPCAKAILQKKKRKTEDASIDMRSNLIFFFIIDVSILLSIVEITVSI